MTSYQLHDQGRKTRLWIALIGLSVVTLLLSLGFMWYIAPPPPKKIRLATAQESGAYYAFGKEYQDRLQRLGLQVDLIATNGSIDNYQRLLRGEADVAFAQSGTYPLVQEKDEHHVLRGLAAVFLEPLWVFYRGKGTVSSLADFRDKKISIGPPASGTEAVSKRLLEAHGIDDANAEKILHLPSTEAASQLKDGSVDVAMFVSSYKAGVIQDLLHQDDIHLLNFRRDVAYSRNFAELTPVKVAEGVLDLKYNIPAEDKVLLAPAALLVCREDLHPQVVEQLLKVARRVHEKGSLMDPPGKFPSLEGIDPDLGTDEAAQTYLTSGESTLSQMLPYWAVRLLSQIKILVLPLLAIWLPFLKILPMIVNWRANRLLHRHYAALRVMESQLAHADCPADLREKLQVLDHLRDEMERLSHKVPTRMQRDVYDWRLHVAMVRNEALGRLRRFEEKGPATNDVSAARESVP